MFIQIPGSLSNLESLFCRQDDGFILEFVSVLSGSRFRYVINTSSKQFNRS